MLALCAEGHGPTATGATPPPPLEGIVVPSRDRLCDARTLEQLMAALEAAVRARALAEERARVQAWRQWIDESWATSPGVVYRWIRGAGDAALQMVRTPSGEFTANIAGMDEVIRAAWAPVNGHYEANPEPSVDNFMHEYRHHVRHSAMKEAPWFAGIRAGDRPGRIGVYVRALRQYATTFAGDWGRSWVQR